MSEHHDARPEPTRSNFVFQHRVRVRWSEVDGQGVVFNPNYFVYFDIAVTEYMRAVGFRYPDEFARTGCDMFAVQTGAQFRASAHYDEEIDIAVRALHVGHSSFSFELAISRGEALLVTGHIVYVAGCGQPRKAVQVPSELVEAIMRFERIPPERKPRGSSE